MAHDSSTHRSETNSKIDDRLSFTRRTALSLIGVGGVSGVAEAKRRAKTAGGKQGDDRPARQWRRDVDANSHELFDLDAIEVDHVFTAARDADIVVWHDEEGVYHADGREREVARGSEFMAVVQGAVDSLSDDRTQKEKVLVASPGEVHPDDSRQSVDLPSHTILDVPVAISVPDGAEGVGTLFTARDARDVEIPNLTVKGPASGAISFSSVDRVRFGNLWVEDVTGIGVRIDGDGETGNSEDVTLHAAYFENTGSQGFETYNVDRISVGQVLGKDTGASVVLLNRTTDASVTSVVGKNPGFDYATFRLANTCANVSVGEVVSRGGVRGLSIITGTHDVTVGEVNIVGGRKAGVLLVDVENVVISGEVVKNNDGPGVNIWSLGLRGTASQINEGITVSDVRFVDDRPEGERRQPWAIYEGGASLHNRYIDNDVRDGGTEGLIRTATERSVVRDNFGGGVASGAVTLVSASDPAARVEGVSERPSPRSRSTRNPTTRRSRPSPGRITLSGPGARGTSSSSGAPTPARRSNSTTSSTVRRSTRTAIWTGKPTGTGPFRDPSRPARTGSRTRTARCSKPTGRTCVRASGPARPNRSGTLSTSRRGHPTTYTRSGASGSPTSPPGRWSKSPAGRTNPVQTSVRVRGPAQTLRRGTSSVTRTVTRSKPPIADWSRASRETTSPGRQTSSRLSGSGSRVRSGRSTNSETRWRPPAGPPPPRYSGVAGPYRPSPTDDAVSMCTRRKLRLRRP